MNIHQYPEGTLLKMSDGRLATIVYCSSGSDSLSRGQTWVNVTGLDVCERTLLDDGYYQAPDGIAEIENHVVGVVKEKVVRGELVARVEKLESAFKTHIHQEAPDYEVGTSFTGLPILVYPAPKHGDGTTMAQSTVDAIKEGQKQAAAGQVVERDFSQHATICCDDDPGVANQQIVDLVKIANALGMSIKTPSTELIVEEITKMGIALDHCRSGAYEWRDEAVRLGKVVIDRNKEIADAGDRIAMNKRIISNLDVIVKQRTEERDKFQSEVAECCKVRADLSEAQKRVKTLETCLKLKEAEEKCLESAHAYQKKLEKERDEALKCSETTGKVNANLLLSLGKFQTAIEKIAKSVNYNLPPLANVGEFVQASEAVVQYIEKLHSERKAKDGVWKEPAVSFLFGNHTSKLFATVDEALKWMASVVPSEFECVEMVSRPGKKPLHRQGYFAEYLAFWYQVKDYLEADN